MSYPPSDNAKHRLSCEDFRRKLADHIDTQRVVESVGECMSVREACHRWLALLAKHYGTSEDRTQMWAHIHKAVSVALTRVQDADLERFATLCLEGIHADPVRVAACEAINQMLTTEFSSDHRDAAWRNAIISRLRTHLTTDLSHARQRWAKIKEGGVEA